MKPRKPRNFLFYFICNHVYFYIKQIIFGFCTLESSLDTWVGNYHKHLSKLKPKTSIATVNHNLKFPSLLVGQSINTQRVCSTILQSFTKSKVYYKEKKTRGGIYPGIIIFIALVIYRSN